LEAAKELGISDQTDHLWRRHYGEMKSDAPWPVIKGRQTLKRVGPHHGGHHVRHLGRSRLSSQAQSSEVDWQRDNLRSDRKSNLSPDTDMPDRVPRVDAPTAH